jgi:hypothetical protein
MERSLWMSEAYSGRVRENGGMLEIAPELRLCPERWLGKGTHDDLRETLRPLVDLPGERVLVTHGLPFLGGGKRALTAALN